MLELHELGVSGTGNLIDAINGFISRDGLMLASGKLYTCLPIFSIFVDENTGARARSVEI